MIYQCFHASRTRERKEVQKDEVVTAHWRFAASGPSRPSERKSERVSKQVVLSVRNRSPAHPSQFHAVPARHLGPNANAGAHMVIRHDHSLR